MQQVSRWNYYNTRNSEVTMDYIQDRNSNILFSLHDSKIKKITFKDNILSKIKNLSYKYSESFNDAIELFDLIDFHENRFNPKRQQLLLKKISIKLRVYFVSVTKEKIEADIDFYKSDGLLYYVDSK